jgi:general secretion pathway protein G
MEHIKNNDLQSGFSFLEMMVVLVIMGLLFGLIGRNASGLLGRGKSTTTQSTLKVVDEAIQEYSFDVGQYPNSLEELNHPKEGTQNYKGPYLNEKFEKKGIKDAWGQDLVYKKGERGANPPYELFSEGDPTKDEKVYA